MPAAFEQLSWSRTPMGIISLRRRFHPSRRIDVYEVKLGDEFLMSSLFTVAEVQLARLGLASAVGDDLDVLVGGLGLGYTATTVLEDPRVRSMVVIEALPEVIRWHEEDLLPDAVGLASDPRVELRCGDFFATTGRRVDGPEPAGRFDAILLDIDHTPRHVLHPSHAAFYASEGLRHLREHLLPGGVFALWSDDPPDDDFLDVLGGVFDTSRAEVIEFPNFHTGATSSNTVYLATRNEGGRSRMGTPHPRARPERAQPDAVTGPWVPLHPEGATEDP